MSNPHALPCGISYHTSDPFKAMSIAAELGRKVGRYTLQDWGFGYGIIDPEGGGFTLMRWATRQAIPYDRNHRAPHTHCLQS